jgi:hypothetical protein
MRAGKNNFDEPIWMGTIVALLLGFRVIWRWKAKSTTMVN